MIKLETKQVKIEIRAEGTGFEVGDFDVEVPADQRMIRFHKVTMWGLFMDVLVRAIEEKTGAKWSWAHNHKFVEIQRET